jgi:signal transduction histidine kinase
LHDITQLKALERMRTEFVANVSHELRTPVTIIKGFSDTLLEDSELSPQERDRFLQKIQKNVIRLHHLLEDLLTLSRMESKADPLQRERQSLNTLVTEICDNFRGRMPEGQVLRAELDTGAPPLDLDSLRITQVLENLLDNALRHARDMRHLTVRTSVVGEQVRCYVEDDGCGIPARDLPHIFERFYRVDKGRSRELGGTGLACPSSSTSCSSTEVAYLPKANPARVPGSGSTCRCPRQSRPREGRGLGVRQPTGRCGQPGTGGRWQGDCDCERRAVGRR